MGYLSKSFKVRRHKRTMRIIAMAALAGCVYERWAHSFIADKPNSIGHYIREHVYWRIVWHDGQISQNHQNKRAAAVRYLKWFLGRHDPLEELQRRANA